MANPALPAGPRRFARRDLSGYFRVNNHFAAELEKIIEQDDLIWVHDYHLIPIADALRRRGHSNRIGFFLHVPLPPPEILTSLPNHEQLIPLLMQYDVVGFQTDGDVQNFVRYLMSEFDQTRKARMFESTGRHVILNVNGQETLIGSFPVGIEPLAFARLARHNEQSPLVKDLVASLGGRMASRRFQGFLQFGIFRNFGTVCRRDLQIGQLAKPLAV
jgi:trehalose 6-phosphate synthase